MSRQASVSRKTNETEIQVTLDLDCAPGSNVEQKIQVSTGIGFLDHVGSTHFFRFNLITFSNQMYTALAKHGGMSLQMTCKGDLWIDDHHTADMFGPQFLSRLQPDKLSKYRIPRSPWEQLLNKHLAKCEA